jgi:hypothetical protein
MRIWTCSLARRPENIWVSCRNCDAAKSCLRMPADKIVCITQQLYRITNGAVLLSDIE